MTAARRRDTRADHTPASAEGPRRPADRADQVGGEAGSGPGGQLPSGGPPTPRSAWRAVALPTEHGGWGLTLEPVVLGLLLAPSGAGAAIGAMAFVAFLARTPLKVVLVDRWRRRRVRRTALAARVAAGELLVLAVLTVVAWRVAAGPFWVPLALALPLVLVELWFDMRSRSRRLIPELAGTIGIGSVAAAIVVASEPAAVSVAALAAGAWVVIIARATASLPFVRFQLRRAKAQPSDRTGQDLAQGVAVVIAGAAAGVGWISPPAAIALGALAVVQLVLARVPVPRVAVVGAQQMVLGLAVVIVAGLTMS